MCNIFFFRGEHIQLWAPRVCERESARSGEKMCERVSERDREYVWFCVNIYRARRKEKKRKQERKQISIIRYERCFSVRRKRIKTWKSKREGNKTDWLKFGDFPPELKVVEMELKEEVCRRSQLDTTLQCKVWFK